MEIVVDGSGTCLGVECYIEDFKNWPKESS